MSKIRGRVMRPLEHPESGNHIGWGDYTGYITTPTGKPSQTHLQNHYGGLHINKTHLARKAAWDALFGEK